MDNFIAIKDLNMETMLIELTNEKAVKLIHELEEQQLIKVLQTKIHSKEKLSMKYAGSLQG